MATVKEKSMVKVGIRISSGELIEYKGIVAFVTKEKFILIPFDSISKNADGLHFMLNEVESITTARFPKEVSDLLKETFISHQEVYSLEREIKALQDKLKEKQDRLWKEKRILETHTEKLNSKRFEVLGGVQDIATKLKFDIEKADVNCIYEPGNSTKSVHLEDIIVVGKELHATIRFDKMLHGEYCTELYWLDYERYYDCDDWETFKLSHCPNMKSTLVSLFPFAKVHKEWRECGRGEEKRRIPTSTYYTISFKANKESYKDLVEVFVEGMKRLKQRFVMNNQA